MTANLFKERAVYRREPAWHGLGTVFTAPIGASEAIEAIGAGFTVEMQTLRAVGENSSTIIPVKGLMRPPLADDDQWRYFGTVSEGYGLVQNSEIGLIIDPLTEKWPVETCGLLGHGETLFLALDAGLQDVEGDPVHQYFSVVDTKDGNTGLRAMFTPVRMVCQNTVLAGEESAVALRNFRHTTNVAREFGWHMALINQFQSAQEKVMADFRLMAKALLSDITVEVIINSAYPLKKQPAKSQLAATLTEEQKAEIPDLFTDALNVTQEWERMNARVEECRVAALEMAEATHKSRGATGRLTAWDVYNGVVEVEDYREGINDNGYARSALFGDRARTKIRGFKAAMKSARAPQ